MDAYTGAKLFLASILMYMNVSQKFWLIQLELIHFDLTLVCGNCP